MLIIMGNCNLEKAPQGIAQDKAEFYFNCCVSAIFFPNCTLIYVITY